ncbi:hypothetical protein HPB47_018873, partial [Ixodes persulcatus]
VASFVGYNVVNALMVGFKTPAPEGGSRASRRHPRWPIGDCRGRLVAAADVLGTPFKGARPPEGLEGVKREPAGTHVGKKAPVGLAPGKKGARERPAWLEGRVGTGSGVTDCTGDGRLETVRCDRQRARQCE